MYTMSYFITFRHSFQQLIWSCSSISPKHGLFWRKTVVLGLPAQLCFGQCKIKCSAVSSAVGTCSRVLTPNMMEVICQHRRVASTNLCCGDALETNNTGKLTQLGHCKDWQTESSFLIRWVVAHGCSWWVEWFVWLIPIKNETLAC